MSIGLAFWPICGQIQEGVSGKNGHCGTRVGWGKLCGKSLMIYKAFHGLENYTLFEVTFKFKLILAKVLCIANIKCMSTACF